MGERRSTAGQAVKDWKQNNLEGAGGQSEIRRVDKQSDMDCELHVCCWRAEL